MTGGSVIGPDFERLLADHLRDNQSEIARIVAAQRDAITARIDESEMQVQSLMQSVTGELSGGYTTVAEGLNSDINDVGDEISVTLVDMEGNLRETIGGAESQLVNLQNETADAIGRTMDEQGNSIRGAIETGIDSVGGYVDDALGWLWEKTVDMAIPDEALTAMIGVVGPAIMSGISALINVSEDVIVESGKTMIRAQQRIAEDLAQERGYEGGGLT